jgi:hypothetical protein
LIRGKSWPVLVVCSTSDFKRQNRDDLVDFYRRVGLAEGWVLLAGDGPQPARNDTGAWRGAMTSPLSVACTAAFPAPTSGQSRVLDFPVAAKA